MTQARADVRKPSHARVEPDLSPPVLGTNHGAVWAWAVVVWSLALVLMALMAIPAAADAIQPLDRRVWQLAVDSQWTPMITVARALGIVGSVAVMGPVVVVGGVLLWRKRQRAAAVAWLGTFAVAEPLSLLLKVLYERPRPPSSLVETFSYAFPSGHAVMAAAVALAAALVWIGEGPRQRRSVVLAVCWALVIAASRVYLRAHWLTDVAAGLTLGAGVALVAVAGVASWSKGRATTGKRTVPS